MKIYTVYLKDNADPLEEAEYVSEGFAWKGFIFNFFWLIYHKLWIQAAVTLVIMIAIRELANVGVMGENAAFLLNLGICAYIGFAGRDFLRRRLEHEGFNFADVVLAQSIDEAEYKFIDSLIKQHKELNK